MPTLIDAGTVHMLSSYGTLIGSGKTERWFKYEEEVQPTTTFREILIGGCDEAVQGS